MILNQLDLKSVIRAVPDFPKPGVMFRDITPLFQSPRALRFVADSFIQRYVEADFSHIGAMDARGFLIGSIIAYELNKPLVLFRKQGKLPADVLAQGYQTEARESKELTKWHIHHLREALEADKANPTLIINVRNSGYRLLVD